MHRHCPGLPTLPVPSHEESKDPPGDASSHKSEPAPMGIHPQLPTPVTRSVIKSTMRTVVVLLIDRFPQVVRAMWVLGLTYLLRRIAGLAEIPIPEPRCQLIALDHEDRGGADEHLADDGLDGHGRGTAEEGTAAQEQADKNTFHADGFLRGPRW